MSWADLPPLAMLRALAAYAETGGTTQAGALLNVSHAAISQQLRALEAHLGVRLFDRSARSLKFTPEGHLLAESCLKCFSEVSETVGMLTETEAARPIHVSTTPSFATNWLMPRLHGFRAKHPDIGLVIDPTPQTIATTTPGIDLWIRYGQGNWPHTEIRPLVLSPMVVVGAPELVGKKGPFEPHDLAQYPWIEELGVSESQRWMVRHGLQSAKRPQDVTLPGSLHLAAALTGQGIAAMVMCFAQAELDAGRLVLLHREDNPKSGYYALTRPTAQRPALKTFLKWLWREGPPSA